MGRQVRLAEAEYFTCDVCGEECRPFHRTCEVCGRAVCPQGACHEVYPVILCRLCLAFPSYLEEWWAAWEALRKSQEEIVGRWRSASIQNL